MTDKTLWKMVGEILLIGGCASVALLLAQDSPPAVLQVWPQVPQLFGSTDVSVQTVLHEVSLPPHVLLHVDPEQVARALYMIDSSDALSVRL